MKRLIVGLVVFLAVFGMSLAVLPSSASAAVAPECDTSVSFLGFPTWYKYLDVGPRTTSNGGQVTVVDKCAILGPTGGAVDDPTALNIPAVVGRIAIAMVELLLRLAAVISVGFVMYGGFKFITSQGDPDGAKAARQTIQNSLIGLIISVLATGIVSFIATQFIV